MSITQAIPRANVPGVFQQISTIYYGDNNGYSGGQYQPFVPNTHHHQPGQYNY